VVGAWIGEGPSSGMLGIIINFVAACDFKTKESAIRNIQGSMRFSRNHLTTGIAIPLQSEHKDVLGCLLEVLICVVPQFGQGLEDCSVIRYEVRVVHFS